MCIFQKKLTACLSCICKNKTPFTKLTQQYTYTYRSLEDYTVVFRINKKLVLFYQGLPGNTKAVSLPKNMFPHKSSKKTLFSIMYILLIHLDNSFPQFISTFENSTLRP